MAASPSRTLLISRRAGSPSGPCTRAITDSVKVRLMANLALVQVRDEIVAVERRVRDQRPERDPVDKGRHADRVEALPWQEHKAHKVAERVGERQDLGGQAAVGPADGLAQSPPFAPCP